MSTRAREAQRRGNLRADLQSAKANAPKPPDADEELRPVAECVYLVTGLNRAKSTLRVWNTRGLVKIGSARKTKVKLRCINVAGERLSKIRWVREFCEALES